MFHYPAAGETATVGCSRVPFQHGGGSILISLSVGFLFCVSLFFVLVLFSFVFILFRGSCSFIIFFLGLFVMILIAKSFTVLFNLFKHSNSLRFFKGIKETFGTFLNA